jgi:hypothetical protein
MSFGVGAFPFGLFQTTFTTNNTDYQYAPRTYFDKIFFLKNQFEFFYFSTTWYT